MDHLLFLAITLIFNASAQLLYKGYALYRKRSFLLSAIFAFLLVPCFSYLALKGLAIDTVYMATSLTIIMVTSGSVFFYGERVHRHQWLGGGMILLGILLYNI